MSITLDGEINRDRAIGDCKMESEEPLNDLGFTFHFIRDYTMLTNNDANFMTN